mgnify:CR=1 FL=1
MIYKGKRIKGLNVYKIKGKRSYILVDEASAASCAKLGYPPLFDAVEPLIEIDTVDPKVIQAIKHRLRVNAGSGFLASTTVHPSWLYKNAYQVSWSKVPQAWKDIFEPDVRQAAHLYRYYRKQWIQNRSDLTSSPPSNS